MAVALVRAHNATTNKTASNTLAYPFLNVVTPAGNLLLLAVISDNAATANKPVITSITVPAGETASWVFLGRATYPSAGTSGAFSNGEIWAIKTTVAWAAASTSTITWDSSVTMRGAHATEFSGAEVTLRSTVGTAYSTTTTAASASTTGTTPVIGDVAVGLLFNSNTSTSSSDTDTLGGSWSSTNLASSGGTSADNAGRSHFKVLTSASHQTLNAASGATAGNGSIVAILQASAGGGSTPASLAVTTSRTAAATASGPATASLAVTTSRTAAASVSSGTFSPSDLTGLASWYDADDASSFTYSGGTSVSQWNDKSGLGRHLAQATTSLQPSRSGVQNGRATVLHDGTDDYMDTAAFTLAQPMTVFIAQDNGGQSSQGWLSSVGGSLQIYTGGSLYIYAGTTPAGLSLTGAYSGAHVWSFYANGASTAGYKDGTLLATGDTGSNGTTTGWRTAERNLTSGYRLQGELFEIIVYDRVLTTTERQQVEAYLDNKWISGPPPSGGTTYTATAALAVTTSRTASATRTSYTTTGSLAVTTTATATASRLAAPATGSLAVVATLSATATRIAAPATGSLAITTSRSAAATRTTSSTTTALAVTTARTASATRTTTSTTVALAVTTNRSATASRTTSTTTGALAVTTTATAAAIKTAAGVVSALPLAVTTTRTATVVATRTTTTVGLAVTTTRTAAAGRTTTATASLSVTTSRTATATKTGGATVTASLAITTTRTAAATRTTRAQATLVLTATFTASADVQTGAVSLGFVVVDEVKHAVVARSVIVGETKRPVVSSGVVMAGVVHPQVG